MSRQKLWPSLAPSFRGAQPSYQPMRIASRRSIVVAVAMVCAATSFAQQPPAFDVASIKRNMAGRGSPQRVGVNAGDRLTLTNVPLLTLIQIAYEPVTEVVGGPTWMGRPGEPNFEVDRFDVAAKAVAPATRSEERRV